MGSCCLPWKKVPWIKCLNGPTVVFHSSGCYNGNRCQQDHTLVETCRKEASWASSGSRNSLAYGCAICTLISVITWYSFFLYNTASMSKFSSSQVTGSWHKELPFFCCRNSSYVIFICNDSISKQNFILRYWWLEYYCNFSGDTKSQPEHMHWATLLPFHRILQLWAVSLPPVPSSASTWFVTKQCCSEREACWLVVLHQAILRNE